ncbi:endonuclease domain-containing protein [Afipia massiliensis]|uniref:Endonuclease domain-containing protein n=1 Tax=Afipia massiliensis TaxID=211460 RepID=A0A4U6BT73_9BRAD|nr:endonuclease domain-containing protein [Afipia massiliensis]TKT71994.1 endonuclease domain-containing protein [Afipia massiliensis]
MGLHIRRQAPVGRYIVDFVCFSRKIIIEADGGQHNLSQHAELDRIRDNFLRSQGYHIIRFWNSDIDANLDGVMDVILSKLAAPHPDRLAPVDPPHEGEG